MARQDVHITLADSQYLTSMGLRYVLSANPNLKVVSVAGHRAELSDQLGVLKPDLVILDYKDEAVFGLNDLQLIRNTSPDIKILIISADRNKLNIAKAVEYGISGFLTKQCKEAEILEAIDDIMQGKKFFCNRVTDVLEERKSGSKNLSKREREIVQLVAKGYSTKIIAEKLFLSPHTVSTHRKNILRKLNLNTVSDLIAFALSEGIIEPE